MLIRLISSLLVSAALCFGQAKAPKAPKAQASRATPPRTVDEAVRLLKTKWLSEKDRNWILRNPKDQVTATLHLPFGTAVRNEFQLWGGNPELLASCGVDDPEECSGIIFHRLWESIRREADPELVKKLDCQFQMLDEIKIDYRGFYALRLGEMLQRMQEQIDRQLLDRAHGPEATCAASLCLLPTGSPNLRCYVRAEFSEDGRKPSLSLFLGWIAFRNGFDVLHSPPQIELPFRDKCAWSEQPRHFQPKGVRKP